MLLKFTSSPSRWGGSAYSVAATPESLEAVEDEVKAERELDIVVASAEDAFVAGRLGQLADARVAGQRPTMAASRFG